MGLRIRDWRGADGASAIYAMEFEPFVAGMPLLFWAHLGGSGDDADDEIVGMVSHQGRIIPADEVRSGEFYGYALPNFDDAVRQHLQTMASLRGQALQQEKYPPRDSPRPPAPSPTPAAMPVPDAPPAAPRERGSGEGAYQRRRSGDGGANGPGVVVVPSSTLGHETEVVSITPPPVSAGVSSGTR